MTEQILTNHSLTDFIWNRDILTKHASQTWKLIFNLELSVKVDGS